MLTRFSRILVVDDSSTTRRAVRAILAELGHVNVDEATDGAFALARLEQRPYALVISDWMMEPMSGLELLMKMRRSERWARTPFIMMTARSQKKFMDVARDEGATHFLPKPFTASGLAEKIAAIRTEVPTSSAAKVLASYHRA